MSDERSSLSVLGGPRSGKSSYLGALWNALEAAQTGLIRLPVNLPDDTRALGRLASEIAGGNYPQRTNPDERHDLNFVLELVRPISSQSHFSVHVSDYNGEEVESLYRYRTSGWSEEWRRRARSSGILLFVRPTAVEALPQSPGPPPTEEARWKALIDKDAAATTHGHMEPVKALPDDPAQMFGVTPLVDDGEGFARVAQPNSSVREPTELAVIELLQFIREVRGLAPGERPSRDEAFRVAVMLSAWDAVDPNWHKAGPRQYLIENLPLLNDFLWSNFRLDRDVHCFALSSTGGDLTDSAFKSRYRREHGVPGRVAWNDNFGRVRQVDDLSIPLLWALLGDAIFAQIPADAR